MDSILYWNDVALEANRISHTNGANEQTGPTLSSRALGIVHLAMYDAYAGAVNTPATLPLYLSGLTLPAPGASAPAAVAAAAYATLNALFPSQNAFFTMKLAQAGLSGPGVADGHAFGLQVAAAILADRGMDPGAGDSGYMPSMARGAHRPDPDNPGQGFHAPYYGRNAKCFAVTARHALSPPPSLGSGDYQKALRQVRAKGIAPVLAGTLPAGSDYRSPNEYVVGLYWGYDGASGLGTPPRLYNQIIREVAIARRNSEADNARLFAFVNAAMADAGILAWEQKYRYDLWRPVVGIREHDTSMGPSASPGNVIDDDCDPAWLPLGAPSTNSNKKNFTPPFPAYPSGHATFGAAALHLTRLFYGVKVGDREADKLFDNLALVSDEFNGINRDNLGAVRPRHVRNFPKGLMEMIEENGRSRVYLGVHWVFDAFAVKGNDKPDYGKNIGGVPLGLKIAEDIFQSGNGKAPKKSTV
jgi:vanadium chloroperoxidase